MYAGVAGNLGEVFMYRYMSTTMHVTRGLIVVVEARCKAAVRAVIGLQSRCHQLHIHAGGGMHTAWSLWRVQTYGSIQALSYLMMDLCQQHGDES